MEREHVNGEDVGRRRSNIRVRGRTLSSSRAEDIVTAEQKARRLAPDSPVHSPRDSLFSWTSGFTKYEGMFNWGALLLIISSVRVCLENLIKYGFRVSPAGWIRFIVGDLGQEDDILNKFPVLYLLGYIPVPVINAFILEKMLAHSHLDWSSASILHSLNLVFTLAIPVVTINSLPCGIVSALIACMSYTCLVLKLVSYIQVNKWCRDKQRRGFFVNSNGKGDFLQRERMKSLINVNDAVSAGKVESSEDESEMAESESKLVKWPQNINAKDLSYFMVAPTLCYELNFPKTSRKRKFFLFRRVLEVILGTNLMLALIQQWMVPNVINSLVPFHSLNWPLTIERLLKLALPNHVIWLIFFYIYFHSFLNTLGELLNFADRSFYQDWWNATNLEMFWQSWNVPVHKWCSRHLYKPLLRSGYSKQFAVLAVFSVSAVLHEYLLSVPLKMFKPWAFLGMMSQIPLIHVSKRVEAGLGGRAGNVMMWASLVLGHPLAVLSYHHDYILENYGPSLLAHHGSLHSATL